MSLRQIPVERIELMPNLPAPYRMKDWKHHARAYDALVFDFGRTGDFLPLIWWDQTRRNFDRDTFGLYSYVGDRRRSSGDKHEGINCIATVLGSTLAGIDKSDQDGRNWVLMCESYFGRDSGQGVFLNTSDWRTGRSFWYELYPAVLATGLAHFYPEVGRLREHVIASARRWAEATRVLASTTGEADFNWTAFDLASMKPVFDGRHREPEAAAGLGWILYTAYAMTGETEFLDAARACMDYLNGLKESPFYEVLLPYGAYAAARMNAEIGTSYDVGKMLNWCFDGTSTCRKGWGVIAERWGEVDCHGLCGSLIDWGQYVVPADTSDMDRKIAERGGYAFTMNTFALAAAFVPLVRYDPRFARAIGKWMLNVANNARLFYPREHDAFHQSCSFWKGDPEGLIAYEGLRKEWDGRKPYATGDPIRFSWGSIDLGLYGSSHVGIFGGIISSTEVEGVLCLDCLKTDYQRDKAHPTYLLFNPHENERNITLPDHEGSAGVYDCVSKQVIPRAADGLRICVPANGTMLAVVLPRGTNLAYEGNRVKADGVIVDYMRREK